MKPTYKPNFVGCPKATGNHSSRPTVADRLKRSTRKCRFAFAKHSAGRRIAFPYLILHHEEFAWPRLLPDAPVSSYLTISPITSTSEAGLFSVALVVARACRPAPGRYPARCPSVFGLSSSAHGRSDCPVRFITRRRLV